MPWGKGSHKTAREKFPTRKEIRALLAAAPKVGKEIDLAIRLAYYFGLRSGEVRILRRRHIDLTRWILWAPTLKKGRRKDRRRKSLDPALRLPTDVPVYALTCPDNEDARDTLRAAYEQAVAPSTSPHSDAWVFPQKVPGAEVPRFTSWFRLWFGKVRKAAKVRPTLSFHALRHAHGTAVAAATKDPVFVRDRLRHASIVTTNIYMHSTGKYDKELGGALDLGDTE